MMKMMMPCNPYEKTIDYYWFDESQGKDVDMSDMSDAPQVRLNLYFQMPRKNTEVIWI